MTVKLQFYVVVIAQARHLRWKLHSQSPVLSFDIHRSWQCE